MALVLGKAVIARPRSGEGYTFELPSGILPDGKQSYLSVNPMGYAEWSSMSEREGFPAKRVGQEVRDAVMPSFSRPARAFSTSNGTGLRPSTDAGSLDALGYRVGERLLISGDGNAAVLSVPGSGHHLFARSATSEWGWEALLVPADTVPGTAAGISRTGAVVAALGQSTLTSTDVLCTVYGAARTAIHVETLAGAAAAVRTPATAATAATWGAYAVTASSETATAWQAFAASGAGWTSPTGIYDPTTGLPLEAGGAATLVADPAYVGEWVKLSSTDTATALRGDALVLARGATLTGAPAAFRVYGSNDDATWDLLGDFSGVVWDLATTEKTFALQDVSRVAERGYKHLAIAVGEVQTDAESTGDGSVSIGAGTRLTAVRVQAKVAISGDGSTVVVAHRDVATGNVHVRLIRTGVLDATAPVAHSVATTLPWGDVQTGRGVATDFFGRTFAVRSADAVEAWRLTSAWTPGALTFSALSAGVPDADHTLLGASGVALSSSGQEVFVPVRNLVSGRVLVGAARVPYGTWPASATLVPSSEAVTTGPVATPDAWTAGARLCAQSPDATWLSFLLPDGTGYVFCTESSGSSTGVPGGAVHGISERGDMVVWDAESTTVLADTTVTTSLGVARVIAGTYAWGSVQDGLIVRSGTWSGTVLANWGLAYYDTAVAGGVVETHEKVTGWSVLRRPPAVLSAPLYQEKVGEASLSFVATKDGSARPPFVVPPSSSISVTLNGRFLGRYINDTTGYVTAYLTRLTQPNTSSAADATAVSDTLMTTDINDASVQSLALEKDTRYVLAVYYYNKGTQTSVSLEGTATALEVGAGAVFLREATHVLDLLQQVTFAAGFDPNPSPGQATPWSLSTTSAQDAYDAGRPAKIFNNGLYLIAVADFDTATEEVFHSNYIEFDEVPAGTDPDYYSFRLVNYQTRDVLAYVAITAAKNGGITSGVWFDLSSSIMDSVLYYKDPEAPEVITSSSGVTGGGGGSGETTTQVISMDGGRADLVSARSLTGDALPVVQAYSDGTTTVASAYLDTTGVFSLSGVVSLVDGSASEPAFRFSSSTQTGLLYDAARQALAVSVSGTVPARFYSGAVEIIAAALRPATTATTALGSAGLRFGGLFLAGDADLLGEVRAGDAGYTFGSTPGFGVVLSAGQDAVEVQAGGVTKAAFLAAEVRVSADVAPETDAAYDLGVTGRRFRDVRASGTVSATDVAVSGAVTATGSTAKLEFPTAGIDANTVRATGSFFPAADATYDLGSPDRRWKTLYVDSNTIYLGDIKLGADASGDFSVEKQVVDHSTGQITTQQATIKTDRVQIWDTTSSSVGSRIRSVDSATYMEVSGNGVDFTEVLRLSVGTAEFTGDVRASGDILALSDRRLKTEIQPITGALDRIAEMQGVTYRFAKAEGGKRNIGLIAQEVQAAFPEAVTEGSDGMLAVNYGGLVGALVAALNESRAETRALAERVAALEGSR